MADDSTHRDSRNSIAAVYMMTAVVAFSLLPLLLAWGAAAEGPFLFNAGFRLGTGIGYALFVFAFYQPILRDRNVLTLIVQHSTKWTMLFIVINYFEFALFAWSTQFVNIAVTVIIYETWPIFTIFLMARLLKEEKFYRTVSVGVILSIVVSFAGFLFVVASQFGGSAFFSGTFDTSAIKLAIGVALAAAAAVSGSFTAFAFKWGIDLKEALPKAVADKHDPDSLRLFCIVIANTIGSLIAAPTNALLGFANGESLSLNSLIISVLVSGFIVHTFANTIWRLANIKTDNLGINAMAYGVPVLSLLWLALFSYVGDVRGDFIIIGTAAIISANIFINFEAEIRWGFKAFILAMWSFGAFVYLRDDLLNLLPFDTWLWPGDTYPEALGLSATVFILLLSFRVARMSERANDEDNRILELFQSLDLLVRRKVIDRAVRDHLIKLDDARTPAQLQDAYHKAKLCFAQAVADGPDARNLARLGAAETQLNIIVHSRQQGIELGELFALLIFGGSTICIGILSRPPLTGWIGFLVEVLAFLFSAVIVFLIINVWDLHRERADLILEKHEDSDDYGLIFRNARSRRFEQSMSVVIGLAITAAYATLLWQKWLP